MCFIYSICSKDPCKDSKSGWATKQILKWLFPFTDINVNTGQEINSNEWMNAFFASSSSIFCFVLNWIKGINIV